MRDSEKTKTVEHGGSIFMGRKKKMEAAEKLELIQDYLSGKISLREAARRAGAANTSVKQWVDNYEAEGIAAFMPHKQRVYSPDLKRQAVQDYLSGKGSQSDISKKYGLRDRKQLRAWIKVYNTHGDFNSVKHSGGGSYMKQGRDTTQEERIQIVKDCPCFISGERMLSIRPASDGVMTYPFRHSLRTVSYSS